MKKEIRVLPGTVRVENIDLLDFMKDLPEIVRKVPELEGARANGITLTSPLGAVNLSWAAQDVFNMSGPNPEILEKLVAAMRKHYQTTIQ